MSFSTAWAHLDKESKKPHSLPLAARLFCLDDEYVPLSSSSNDSCSVINPCRKKTEKRKEGWKMGSVIRFCQSVLVIKVLLINCDMYALLIKSNSPNYLRWLINIQHAVLVLYAVWKQPKDTWRHKQHMLKKNLPRHVFRSAVSSRHSAVTFHHTSPAEMMLSCCSPE